MEHILERVADEIAALTFVFAGVALATAAAGLFVYHNGRMPFPTEAVTAGSAMSVMGANYLFGKGKPQKATE